MLGEGIRQALIGMLGITVPLALGIVFGHPEVGMALGFGGLAFGGEGVGPTLRERTRSLLCDALIGALAMYIGSSVADRGLWTVVGLPFALAIIALIGGISRPLARHTTRFIVFSLLAAGVGHVAIVPSALAILFLAGAAWTTLVALGLWSMRPRGRWGTAGTRGEGTATPSGLQENEPRRSFSARQLLKRWIKSLRSITGWQYSIRIFLCLASAEALALLWPLRCAYWVPLTVAIVAPRKLETGMSKALHRVIGTFVGVLVASALGFLNEIPWMPIVAIALFAAARSVLRSIHYVAYAAVHTPLILLLMDIRMQSSSTLIFGLDRLAATAAGCAIALVIGYLPWMMHARKNAAR